MHLFLQSNDNLFFFTFLPKNQGFQKLLESSTFLYHRRD